MSLRLWFAAALAAASLLLASAQSVVGNATSVRDFSPWVSIAQPSVPQDPLEIAGNAETVLDVTQRARAVKLLQTAQYLSNLRRGPYDLKTRFTSSEGTWQTEDSSPGRDVYRWVVENPAYSAVNLFVDRVIYSSQPGTAIPLRLAQVHSAIFAHYPIYGPRATLRLAKGDLNGKQVACVLVSHVPQSQPTSGPRRWEEFESCVDPQSGLLMSYSPAPGFYVLYDYSTAQHLGDITFPAKFTISEAGKTVVEAQVTSLTQPSKSDSSIYSPGGLTALGVGFPLTPPWVMQNVEFTGRPNFTATAGQVVVVRGMVSPDGTMTDAEVLASSDPNLNQRALERVAQHNMVPQDNQNGATPQSHETFVTTLFVN